MSTFSQSFHHYQDPSPYINPNEFASFDGQYDFQRPKTPTESLVNHSGHSPCPLTTSPPLSRNVSQPPESAHEQQPPEQMLWDNGSFSDSPTSVRTPDGDSFEVEMLDNSDVRDFYHQDGMTMSTQSPHHAIPAIDSSMFYNSQGQISEQAIDVAFQNTIASNSQQYNHHFTLQTQQPQHMTTMPSQMEPYTQQYTNQPHRQDPWNGQGPARSPMAPRPGTVMFDPVTTEFDFSDFVNVNQWTANSTDPSYLISPSEPAVPPQDNMFPFQQQMAHRPFVQPSGPAVPTQSPVEMRLTRPSPPPDAQKFVNYNPTSTLFTESYITGNQYSPTSPAASPIGQWQYSPASPSSSEGMFSSHPSESGMVLDTFHAQHSSNIAPPQPISVTVEVPTARAMPRSGFETSPGAESSYSNTFRNPLTKPGMVLETIHAPQYNGMLPSHPFTKTVEMPNATTIPEFTFERSPEPDSYKSNANLKNLNLKMLSKSGGRALGTHLEPKVAKAAHDMRKTVACWHCVLQRDKCGPGDICERCLKRSQRPNADCGLGCSRIKLVDLSTYFLPALVTQMHENSNLEHFVSQYIHQWGNVELTVMMTCGQHNMPRIPVKVYEFSPRGTALLEQIQYQTDPYTRQRIAVKKQSPALGMVHINYNEEKKYDDYINNIVDNHLDAFGELCWIDDDNDFQQKLFKLMTRIKPNSDDEAKLLREIHRLIVATFIMSHTLTIAEETKISTLSRMHSYRSPDCYVENFTSPRMTNRQLKYFFSRLQRSIQNAVLNKLQQIFKSSRGCEKWIAAFIAVVGMCMALEDEQAMIHQVMTTKAITEGMDERDAQSLADMACREIDARMQFVQQIFQWKHNRKHNPLRDADRNWEEEKGFGNETSVNFVRQVSQLVKDNMNFLQQRQSVSISHANQTKYTSRLVGKFLLSFWLPNV